MHDEESKERQEQAEKAELIRLSYAIEKIRTLLMPKIIERIADMESDTTLGMEALKFTLKIIGQMHVLQTQCGTNADIDINAMWDRWSNEGYSKLFDEFYENQYHQILETPERIAEFFQVYHDQNSKLPPFGSNLDASTIDTNPKQG